MIRRIVSVRVSVYTLNSGFLRLGLETRGTSRTTRRTVSLRQQPVHFALSRENTDRSKGPRQVLQAVGTSTFSFTAVPVGLHGI